MSVEDAKRYEPTVYDGWEPIMEEHLQGDWVNVQDYEELLDKYNNLKDCIEEAWDLL